MKGYPSLQFSIQVRGQFHLIHVLKDFSSLSFRAKGLRGKGFVDMVEILHNDF